MGDAGSTEADHPGLMENDQFPALVFEADGSHARLDCSFQNREQFPKCRVRVVGVVWHVCSNMFCCNDKSAYYSSSSAYCSGGFLPPFLIMLVDLPFFSLNHMLSSFSRAAIASTKVLRLSSSNTRTQS